MHNFCEQHGLGEVIIAPMDVYFDEGNVFQPDIIFVSNERASILQNGKHVKGAPDLVVEILSSNWRHDLNHKRRIYERYNVLEYWIVDPRSRTVEVLVHENGAFECVQRAVAGETAASTLLPGFVVEVAYLFRGLLP